MKISFGRHTGLIVERLLLTKAGYVAWILTEEKPDWKLESIREEVRRLAILFDQKPLLCRCRCGSPATRLSFVEKGYEVRPWCDACTPTALSGPWEKIEVIHDYVTAINLESSHHPSYFWPAPPLLALAYAKGLLKSFCDAALEDFFHQESLDPFGVLEKKAQTVS